MRTLNQISVVQENDAKFPFGSTVQNETSTQEGTAVVREHYGDIMQNMYRLLKLAKINPTGIEDSNDTQYQIVEALKKLPNSMNDIEQVLALNGTKWTVNLDLSILPNKYFLFARADEDYESTEEYTLKGTGSTEYSLVSTGFKSGDPILIIIDTAIVRVYPLNLTNAIDEISTTLGSPIAFTEGTKIWYQDNGKLFNDNPNVYDIELVIQNELEDSTVILNDMFITKGKLLCYCLIPSTNQYFFRQLSLNNLTVSFPVSIGGAEIGNSDDFGPYVYAYKSAIYMSNDGNNTANDYSFIELNFNAITSSLSLVSSVNLDASFVKTTNAAIKDGLLYTLVSGVLNSFNLTSGAKLTLGDFPIVGGQIFGFNDAIYFTSGEIARKWF